MFTVKYLLELAGFVLIAAAAAMLLHDLYRLYLQSNLILNDQPRPAVIEPRFRAAGRITALALVCLLTGLSVQVVPAGMAAFASAKTRPQSKVRRYLAADKRR